MWVTVAEQGLGRYGTLYRRFTGNALSAIPISGRLTKPCYRTSGIDRLARRVGRPIILSDSTVPYDNEYQDS